MADESQDNFASIVDDCRFTSSQEELLSHAKFAREDETFPEEDDESPAPVVEDSGDSRRKLDGGDSERIGGGGDSAVDANSPRAENLGFGGERKGATREEGEISREEREIEPGLKKKRRVSPLVHCSGKVVIGGEDDGEKVVAVSADLKVEVASSSRAGVTKEGGCTEKLDVEDDESEALAASGVRRRLELALDTEVINFEEEEEIGGDNVERGVADKGGGEGRGVVRGDEEEQGNHTSVAREEEDIRGENGEKGVGDKKEGEDHGVVRGDEEQGDGTSAMKNEVEDARGRGKRELPLSMFGLVWGEGSGDGNGNGNGNGDLEGSLKEIKDGNSKDGGGEDAFLCILNVLKVLVSENYSDDNSEEVDIFETAKRCGMTFPRSRFLSEVD